MTIPDLSSFFDDKGHKAASDRAIQTLAPSECVMRLVGERVECLRDDSVHRPFKHHPLVGLTRQQIVMMLKGAEDRGEKLT